MQDVATDINQTNQLADTNADRAPIPYATTQLGASSTSKEVRKSLRNSGPAPRDLAEVEGLERKLDLSLATEDYAHIFVGSGRFEVVSAQEAQLWREERRTRLSGGADDGTTEKSQTPGALIVGGALEPTFFADLRRASGVETRRAELTQFANGELLPKVGTGVQWKDVFLVYQSDGTSNDPLVELLLQTDAVKRAGASRITVIAPSFPYQRGDKKSGEGTPVSAAVIARLLEYQGVSQFVCFDLHAGQAEGFTNVPTENLSALPLLAKAIAARHPGEEFVVALPDEGMGKRLKDDQTRSLIAEILGEGTTFLQMAKDRIEVNEVNEAHIKGGKIDLRGKTVLLLDDMIDTGGTMRLAARSLLRAGATKILAAATHGIFSGDAIEKFRSDRETFDERAVRPISEIFVTDSIPLRRAKGDLIQVVSLAEPLGDVIQSLATKDGRSLKEIMLLHSGARIV